MTPEEKSLLERTAVLAEETNGILRSMRRTARLAAAARIVYWVIILGVSYSAYVFLQPWINTMMSSLGQLQSGLQSLQGAAQSVGQVGSQIDNATSQLSPDAASKIKSFLK